MWRLLLLVTIQLVYAFDTSPYGDSPFTGVVAFYSYLTYFIALSCWSSLIFFSSYSHIFLDFSSYIFDYWFIFFCCMICLSKSSRSFSWLLNSIHKSPFSLINFLFSLSTRWAKWVRISKCWFSVFSLCLKSSVDSPAFFYSSSIYFEVSFSWSDRVLQTSHLWSFRFLAVAHYIESILFIMADKWVHISSCLPFLSG